MTYLNPSPVASFVATTELRTATALKGVMVASLYTVNMQHEEEDFFTNVQEAQELKYLDIRKLS